MKIESIQLKHALHFADLNLKFQYHKSPITLILSEQSSGKTSILRLTYQALTWFAARYRDARTAGLVMLDQDIMFSRLQSKLDIQVSFPKELGHLPEAHLKADDDPQRCAWQLYKTINSQSIGLSKAETQQLEAMIMLYQRAQRDDPMFGLPLIAYYPAERFVNEMNMLNKNNPAIFQTAHAYEISAIPFTTFSRFFEWFREISDIENAQSSQLIQQILNKHAVEIEGGQNNPFAQKLAQAQAQVSAPCLKALKQALSIVLPELSQFFLQYHPKLQLMVTYQGKTLLFQQLSNSIRNLIAMVGDIVRRLCLLNPNSPYPCEEGEGILLIDAIDHQLDENMAPVILARLHEAFPRLQIIATGNRPELLEQANDYQCLKLENKKLYPIQAEPLKNQFDEIYAQLNLTNTRLDSVPPSEPIALLEPIQEQPSAQSLLQLIQQSLNEQQQQELIRLLNPEQPYPTQLP